MVRNRKIPYERETFPEFSEKQVGELIDKIVDAFNRASKCQDLIEVDLAENTVLQYYKEWKSIIRHE